MKQFFFLFLTTVTALPNAYVNISFTQEHSGGRHKTAELKNDLVFDNSEQFNHSDEDKPFSRIQINDQKTNVELDKLFNDVQSSRIKDEDRVNPLSSHLKLQPRPFYNSNQNNQHFRNLSPQDMKNMEFERYIQSYHTGPTVETVYESEKPDMQHTLHNPHANAKSQRFVKFEQQVILPTEGGSIQPITDTLKQIVNHETVAKSSTASLAPKPSFSSLIPSIPSSNNFNVDIHQKPSSNVKSTFNFEHNYDNQHYNDPTYSNVYSDKLLYNKHIPSTEESHNGYGDYYNNIYNTKQATDSHHAAEPRPVVKKTIQIAQPAIKAKKYEVRHPAIQKEYYDIEERVVIKPAGTVVVELERPSSKILKEETTLPLGHPHPAVAAAYIPNRNTKTLRNHPHNIPLETYSNKNLPENNLNMNGEIVDSNQNRPYVDESMYSVASIINAPKSRKGEIEVVKDSVEKQHHTYIANTDKVPNRSEYNHSENKGHIDSQRNISRQSSAFHSNSDKGINFSEYINDSGNTNSLKEGRPEKLHEEPAEEVIKQKQQRQLEPIIKHEHNILLSPSQHNIYLEQNPDVHNMKYIEGMSEVHKITPYQPNQPGSIVVYAEEPRPALKYLKKSEYKLLPYFPSQAEQYNNSAQRSVADSRLQNSAPYAQTRHYSNEDPQSQIEIKIGNKSSVDNKAIFVSTTIRPMLIDRERDETRNSKLEISVTHNGEQINEEIIDVEPDYDDRSDTNIINNKKERLGDIESDNFPNIKSKSDCNKFSKTARNENYELPKEGINNREKFRSIIEGPITSTAVSPAVANTSTGSRVIASTAAQKESTPRESFHKRRIVVNHPFQTVREVVEHEPYTNYHEVQVNEPAIPNIYHSANYYQSHGVLR